MYYKLYVFPLKYFQQQNLGGNDRLCKNSREIWDFLSLTWKKMSDLRESWLCSKYISIQFKNLNPNSFTEACSALVRNLQKDERKKGKNILQVSD
jgi:hypothetical protein